MTDGSSMDHLFSMSCASALYRLESRRGADGSILPIQISDKAIAGAYKRALATSQDTNTNTHIDMNIIEKKT